METEGQGEQINALNTVDHLPADSRASEAPSSTLETAVEDLSISDPSIGSSEAPGHPGSERLGGEVAAGVTVATLQGAELAAAIVQQIEFYFSDQNLPTDAFMLQQVKRNADGWVPLRVIADFRKIKKLTRDLPTIAAALRDGSKVVEISPEGQRVRRIAPLPDVDLNEVRARSVIADNFATEKPTIELVMEMFSRAGEVRMARIRKPAAPEPLLTRDFRTEAAKSVRTYAVIEFATPEQAMRAVEMLHEPDNWRTGLRVRLLLPPPRQAKHTLLPRQVRRSGTAPSNEAGAVAGGTTVETTGNDDAAAPLPSSGGMGANAPWNQKGAKRKSKTEYAAWAIGKQPGGGGSGGEAAAAAAAGGSVGEGVPGKPRMPDGSRGFGMGRGAPCGASAFALSPVS